MNLGVLGPLLGASLEFQRLAKSLQKEHAAVRAQVCLDVVGAETVVAGLAFDEGVCEAGDMAGGDPYLGVHKDGGVEPNHVVALLDKVAPPSVLDVAPQFDAERPIVEKSVYTTVNFRGLENETAPLAKRHDFLHGHTFFTHNILTRAG